MNQDKGFFSRLFDFSFSEFITMSIVKVLYVLAVIASAVAALFTLVGGLMMLGSEVAQGLLMIILSPIVFILYVICARIWLELIIIIFRIEENTAKMAGGGQSQMPSQPTV
ncbi:MAG: DUF4282 domain-containing protein [Armatimonadetes bacterium]|nr:DUF4282 domain-containing protein [Armatimonadota bacterium]